MNRIVILSLVILSLFACKRGGKELPTGYEKISGKTMGTTYNITVDQPENTVTQDEIDALLVEINLDLSTYIDSSFISRFNRSVNGLKLKAKYASSSSPHRHFLMNYYRSKQIYEATDGNFDPTVMPLVHYWGFGTRKEKVEEVDKVKIDSLLKMVGFNLIEFDEDSRYFSKPNHGVQLDFSAIAKGYGVDAICELLDRNEIKNYMVEIGGEVRTKGVNSKGQNWTIGINTPKADAAMTDFQAIVELTGRALASSGNYRNFYEVDGRKYGHTIDPVTGFPRKSDLLSASVFAEDCMTADAYATACMVMGLEKAYQLIKTAPELEGYFIYGDESGTLSVKYTDGLEKLIKK